MSITPNTHIANTELAAKIIELQNQVGKITQVAFQAQVGAAPTQAQFNALLTALITAGVMKAS